MTVSTYQKTDWAAFLEEGLNAAIKKAAQRHQSVREDYDYGPLAGKASWQMDGQGQGLPNRGLSTLGVPENAS